MPNGVLASMRTKYHTLSSVQKVIADYIFAHISEVSLLPISELAAKCDTSETTVMRFLRKLDFDSYQVFRVKIAQEIPHERLESIYGEIDRGDAIETLMEKVVASTALSIQDLQQMITSEDIRKAVELMKSAREILFIGIGSSAFIAFDAYHKFLRLGMRVTASADSHLMSIMASQKTDKESNAGVIALTSYRNSSIKKYADVVLLSSANETRYRSDALVSRILQLVIIDILYVAIVLQMGPEAVERINRSRLAVAGKKR
jgi:RpiR family carbohydrate utilization transcriptional regulator